jgi:hypothetical protein
VESVDGCTTASEQRLKPTTRPGSPVSPGQSGNPKGRPAKGTTIAECIRSLGGENGTPYLQRLHAIAFGDNVRAALSAIAVLLERGYGKVPQDLGADANADVSGMSDQERTPGSYHRTKST